MKPHKNLERAAAVLEAMRGARVLLVDERARDRPRIWLCPACGGQLDRQDRCRFHTFTKLVRARMVLEHVAPTMPTAERLLFLHRGEPPCGCRFCERAYRYDVAGEAEPAWRVALEFADEGDEE